MLTLDTDAPPLGNHRAGNPLSSVVAQADTKKRGITSSDYLRPHTRPSTEPQKQQKLPASTTNKISQSVNDNSKEDLVPRHNINLPALYSKGSSVINSRNRSNSNTASKHIAPAVTIPHGPSRIPWSRKKSYITRDPRPVDTDSERSGKTGGLKSVNKFFGGLLRKEKAVR